MDYIPRHLERKFNKMNDFFKVILVTGARQVGKTTMLKQLAQGNERNYVSLDNKMVRELAQSDPVLFFQTYKPPIMIDEIQYAPELFPQIKIMCDESEETGRFWLTGSQQYKLMDNIQESLAGRVGILFLYSLSQSEKKRIRFNEELDFTLARLLTRQKQTGKNDVIDVYEHIWRGGMPQIQIADAEQRQEYFESYIDTYLMQDATELGGITDFVRFRKFLTATAALVAQQVNYKTLAEGADISEPTAKEWLQVLEGLGIIYTLKPFSNNALIRLSKTAKLYYCDTGLAAHLSRWLTRDTLMNGAANGYYFENYVVMELLKNYAYATSMANLTYYRDSNAKEIDVFIEEGQSIHPLEIKKSANPDRREVKKFSLLEKTSLETSAGGIICMCEEVIPIDQLNCFIPCNLI